MPLIVDWRLPSSKNVHPEHVKVILFGKNVFVHILKDLEMISAWIRVGPKYGDKCPYNTRREYTKEKCMCTQKQRLEWYSHMPRNAWRNQKLGEARDNSLEFWRGHGPANKLISEFWPPKLWENKIPLFSATTFVVVCYGSLKKQI